MDALKNTLFTNWHFARLLRLAIGVWMLIWGIQHHDWAIGLLSSLMVFMAATNTGCCSAGGCSVPFNNKKKNVAEETDYEEIK